jgi:hypothetical protein
MENPDMIPGMAQSQSGNYYITCLIKTTNHEPRTTNREL